MNPLISIITVTYNAESSIERTINSVLNQDFKNYEFIIVDGNSQDRTLSIINTYRDEISEVLVERDNGIYDAMNKGLKLANGKFVTFLNSGDYYVNRQVLNIVSKQLNDNFKLVYGDSILYLENNSYKEELKAKKICSKSIKRDFPVCHQSIFANRSLAKMYDLKYKIKGDYKWLIDILNNIDEAEISRVDIPIVNYNKDGMSHKYYFLNLRELIALHYREFGVKRVLLNIDIYIYRTLRHFKDVIKAKLFS